jgi:hypothetical protein
MGLSVKIGHVFNPSQETKRNESNIPEFYRGEMDAVYVRR